MSNAVARKVSIRREDIPSTFGAELKLNHSTFPLPVAESFLGPKARESRSLAFPYAAAFKAATQPRTMPLFVVVASNGGDKVAYIRMLIADGAEGEKRETKQSRRRFAR